MKKNSIGLLTAILALLFVSGANAQIDNLTNVSSEWVRCGTRNAALDGTDIIAYNPGGVSRLKPGFHTGIGNQSFLRHPKHEYSVDFGAGATNYSYKQDGNDLVVPNIDLSYNKNSWAVFGGLDVTSGGGEANYPNGSITTGLIILSNLEKYGTGYTNSILSGGKSASLKASSYTIASMLGGSYKVNEKFSFGIMVRYIIGKSKEQAGVTIADATGTYPDVPLALDAKDDASGIGVVLGADIKPSEKLNLSLRYESNVKLDYKTTVSKDEFGLFVDGSKHRRDLPGVLGLGVAYDVCEKAKLLLDVNYYFQKQADWGTTLTSSGIVKTSELAGDAAFYALAVEYRFNLKFMLSLGGMYTAFSFKDQAGYFTNLGAFEIAPGNNFAIATGFAYNPVEKIRINVGFTQAMYSKNKIKALSYAAAGSDVDVNTSNNISVIGLGVDFLF